MKVRFAPYAGSNNVRKLSKSDWASLGVDQEQTVWDNSNGHTVELSDEAAKKVMEMDPNSFKEVPSAPTSPTDMKPKP